MLVSVSEAAAMIGVSTSTLRRWEKEESFVPTLRTKGGHRRYSTTVIAEIFFGTPPQEKTETIAYARVSSHDQKDDLERQKIRLSKYCLEQKFTDIAILSDLGSGLNYKKKGLQLLIKKICSGQVKRLVLTHKDRLLRFGSDLIFTLCEQFGTEVVVIEASKQPTFQEELAADVIEIMTVFTSRLYGKRSHQNKRAA